MGRLANSVIRNMNDHPYDNKRVVNLKRGFLVTGFLLLILAGCNTSHDVTSNPTISSNGIITPALTSMPILIERKTLTPTPTVKPMAVSPTETPERSEIVTVEGKATAMPLTNEEFSPAELPKKNYELIFNTSHDGPENLVYSVFAFKDNELEPFYGGESNSEICRLAFYRWNGVENVFITSFGTTTYPENSRYEGFPVNCHLADWDDDFWFTDIWGPKWPIDEIRETLNLSGYWSDINQNGLPEVGVLYWYCPNACYGYEGAVQFYKIQDTDTVIPITSNLKGILLPWNVLYSKHPPTLKVFDPSLEYEPHHYIDTWWIYAWDGMQFTDVTSDYAEEFFQGLEQRETRIQEQYGSPITFTRTDFLAILFQGEKYDVREKALEIFLEISDPVHWPGTEQIYVCWLQIIRDQAQRDYDENKPFTVPPTPLGLSMSENFDMQSCQFTNP